MKKIIITAGPNEAGCPERVNADLIAAGLRNFEQIYRDEVDAWALYDNAGDEPVLINWGEKA